MNIICEPNYGGGIPSVDCEAIFYHPTEYECGSKLYLQYNLKPETINTIQQLNIPNLTLNPHNYCWIINNENATLSDEKN
jgi:hypothetical protein